jgi:hypothetical protein
VDELQRVDDSIDALTDSSSAANCASGCKLKAHNTAR